jgi:hypothetical protein
MKPSLLTALCAASLVTKPTPRVCCQRTASERSGAPGGDLDDACARAGLDKIKDQLK